MTKTKKCPICSGKFKAVWKNYPSGKLDRHTGEEIIVEKVGVYKCQSTGCGHSWLPLEEERRIDRKVATRSRFDLQTMEIRRIRESLPFNTKFEVAEFLGLNEKAFTKWELGYSEPNRAYDLLLRLSVFSKDTFEFIKHLHQNNFEFDPRDYQLICEKDELQWNFDVITKSVGSGVFVDCKEVSSGGYGNSGDVGAPWAA